MKSDYHIPVLLKESIELLNINPVGKYVDVTFGGGGHSREILTRLTTGQLLGLDQDPAAAVNALDDSRFKLISSNFSHLASVLHEQGWEEVSGIIADLGISSHQIDMPDRGFSFRFNGPLDMRMDPTQGIRAADIVNEASEETLIRIFKAYGEISNATKLARVIISHRNVSAINHTLEFEDAISSCLPPKRKYKYLAQVYQALRIEVNQELTALSRLLMDSVHLLCKGGRIAIISYHSLEDRMVKHFLRSGNFHDHLERDVYGHPITPWKLITRKAIKPSEEEIDQNPRARSARLRVAEKL